MAVTQTISSGAIDAEFPTTPAGAPFRFALVRGETTTFSDSMSDLVGAIIPGYGAGLGDDEALIARWQCAAATATEVQQLLAAASDLNPADESEDVLTAIFADRANPLPGGSLPDGTWNREPSLVLLATDYAPFTAAPAPNGNVLFVDSSTERAFLRSLTALGVFVFYARSDES
jgi:hypothetical protein